MIFAVIFVALILGGLAGLCAGSLLAGAKLTELVEENAELRASLPARDARGQFVSRKAF